MTAVEEFLSKLDKEFDEIKKYFVEEKGLTAKYTISREDFYTNIHMRLYDGIRRYDLSLMIKEEVLYSRLPIDDVVKMYAEQFKERFCYEIFGNEESYPPYVVL